MFEKFTSHARRVVVVAGDEARACDHDHIGTEHLLVGVLRQDEGAALLRALDVAPADALEQARDANGLGRGWLPSRGHIPFTPRPRRSWSCPRGRPSASGTGSSAASTCCSR